MKETTEKMILMSVHYQYRWLHMYEWVCVCYLFSVEQKKETQGLRFFLSEEGGRYMASEKQVRSNFSSSVLNKRVHRMDQHHTESLYCSWADIGSELCPRYKLRGTFYSWKIRLVSTLWWTNYVTVAVFLNYLKHIWHFWTDISCYLSANMWISSSDLYHHQGSTILWTCYFNNFFIWIQACIKINTMTDSHPDGSHGFWRIHNDSKNYVFLSHILGFLLYKDELC